MKIDVNYFAGINGKTAPKWIEDESKAANALAKALKVLRAYHGYTLKQVGEGTDIPFQAISRYERGENVPSAIQIFKLAYFYKLPVNDMFLLGFFDKIEENYQHILDYWDKPFNIRDERIGKL